MFTGKRLRTAARREARQAVVEKRQARYMIHGMVREMAYRW